MKRSPLKRRTGLRAGPPKLKAMDALLRQVVMRRDQACRRCGKGQGEGRGFALQAAHIYGKAAHPALRYELSNVILLCQPCHFWWHHKGFGREAAPKNEVRAWCVETLGAEYMRKLDGLTVPGMRSKPDRKLEKIMLEGLLR